MEIIENEVDGEILKIVVSSNEETLFSLVKVYLEKSADVDIVGVHKQHHLVDKTELHLKVKSGKKPLEVLKKALVEAKKDLKTKKLK